MIRKFLLILLPALAVAGCQKPDNSDKPGNGGGKEENEPFLTINDFPEVIELFSEMEVQALCNTNYKYEEIVVSASEDWPILRRVNNIVHISVPYWGADADGNVTSPRSCTVTIKAGKFSQTAKLIQESDEAGVGPMLYGRVVSISPIGETISLPVTSQCISWTAATSADWLSVKVLDNSLEITSSPKAESTTSKRKAEILVRSSINAKASETVLIEESDPMVDPGDYGYDDEHSNWD